MPDNPAVRAVAAGFVQKHDNTITGDDCSACGDYPWGLARQALAALASSQEVRTWLLAKFEKDHAWQPTEYDPCWSLREVLNALGGGE